MQTKRLVNFTSATAVKQTDVIYADQGSGEVAMTAQQLATYTDGQLTNPLTATVSWDAVPGVNSTLGSSVRNAQAQALLDRTETLNPANQAEPGTYTGAESWVGKEGSTWSKFTLSSIANFIVTIATLFIQAGSGAVARTILAKLLDQPVTPMDYFNPAIGETWVTGMRRAIAALSAVGGGTIRLPAGTWAFQISDLIQDPTPNTSNFRYLFAWASNVYLIGDGEATVIFVPDNCINVDSANYYWKGYQIFWGGSQAMGAAAVNNVLFDNFKVDCNYANNQVAPMNSHSAQAMGAVFSFNYGSGYTIGDGVHIEGATGHQPCAFYRGTTNVRIGRIRYTNCGQTSGTNPNLTDQSSLYIESDYYSVNQPSHWGPYPDNVSTAIECHGNYGQVYPGQVTNYNVGVIRAAMVSDSQNVVVRGGEFYNVNTLLQPDANPGRKLDVIMYDPVFYARPKAQAGSRTPTIVNTSSQFANVTNQTGNYTKLLFQGAKCFSSTGSGVKSYIGGFVNELFWQDNHLDGFDYNYEIGHHAQNGVAYFRRNTYENMSGVLLNWAQYSAAADAIDGVGTPPTTVKIAVTGEIFTESTAFTAVFKSNQVTAPIINSIDLSDNKALTYAPQPFTGNWDIVINNFVVRNYIVNGVSTRLFASFPPMDVDIRDIGNKCTFFKQAGDTYLWVRRRGATAPASGTVGAAFLGTDYAGDLFEVEQPTSAAGFLYVCTAQSGVTGTSGTWSSMLSGANTWASQQTFTGGLVSNGLIAGNANFRVNAASGPAYRAVIYTTAGISRFDDAVSNEAESGSNAGSNRTMSAYSDAGALLGTVYKVWRNTQVMQFYQPIQQASFTVATLPAGTNSQICYASNGLKPGESTGAGTGVQVIYSNGNWRRTSDYAVVSA